MKTIKATLDNEKDQADFLKLFTHPARIAILQILRDGEECVCHMETILGYRQAYLSQQLSVLREGGVIEDRRDGWNIFYRVVKPDIFLLLDTVCAIVEKKVPTKKLASKNENCPCPKCNSKPVNIGNEQILKVQIS